MVDNSFQLLFHVIQDASLNLQIAGRGSISCLNVAFPLPKMSVCLRNHSSVGLSCRMELNVL
uniref:Uncharacterized protein n=1 Tax=Rhizophora mucronata TaxID=61149 RepID=A0A2P2N5C0_RHIMU